MGIIKWDSKYEVDVRKIDRQHRRIVDILNRLYDMQDGRAEDGEMQKILDDLRAYITTHFETEETYLREHECPGYDEQKDEHSAFIDVICGYQKDFLKNRPYAIINIFNYVWDWFSHHILTVDKKCMAGGTP